MRVEDRAGMDSQPGTRFLHRECSYQHMNARISVEDEHWESMGGFIPEKLQVIGNLIGL